ncbi:MAG: hypothetical protein HGA78_02430 [Nitrospirales bacterium]|nr:hypothetical protein [Nitrospirales bacterium]
MKRGCRKDCGSPSFFDIGKEKPVPPDCTLKFRYSEGSHFFIAAVILERDHYAVPNFCTPLRPTIKIFKSLNLKRKPVLDAFIQAKANRV